MRLAETLAFQQLDDAYYALPADGYFEPGDIAYLEGYIHDAFTDHLVQRGYHTSFLETPRANRTGRYCLVLRRLGDDRYLVCYLTSFGGASGYEDVNTLMGRTYGLPLGESVYWPGIPSLETRPMWNGGFIFAIPVVREGLSRSNLSVRCRLVPSELERAKILIRERLQVRITELIHVTSDYANFFTSSLDR